MKRRDRNYNEAFVISGMANEETFTSVTTNKEYNPKRAEW